MCSSPERTLIPKSPGSCGCGIRSPPQPRARRGARGRCARRPAGGGAGGGRALCPRALGTRAGGGGSRSRARGRGGRSEPGTARRGHGDRHRDQPQDPGETPAAGSLPPPAAGGQARLREGQAQPAAEAPGSGRPPVTAAGGGVLRPRDSPGRAGTGEAFLWEAESGRPVPRRALPGAVSVPGLRLSGARSPAGSEPPLPARPVSDSHSAVTVWKCRQVSVSLLRRERPFIKPSEISFLCTL